MKTIGVHLVLEEQFPVRIMQLVFARREVICKKRGSGYSVVIVREILIMINGERPVPANVCNVQPGMLRLVQQIIPIADHALKERIVRPVLQAVIVKGAHLVMELQRQPDVMT